MFFRLENRSRDYQNSHLQQHSSLRNSLLQPDDFYISTSSDIKSNHLEISTQKCEIINEKEVFQQKKSNQFVFTVIFTDRAVINDDSIEDSFCIVHLPYEHQQTLMSAI